MALLWIAIAFTATVLARLVWQDWPFLMRARRSATGVVVGHERRVHEGDDCYCAVILWRDDDGREHRFVDPKLDMAPTPALDARLDIVFPEGRPDLARIPRRRLRMVLYIVAIGLLALLVARALTLAPASD